MALWYSNASGNTKENNLNPAGPLSWEKNQKLHNQTVCALAVALLCALLLALLVLDFRFERPFIFGSQSEATPLDEALLHSTQPQAEHVFRTWLFVSLSFVSGLSLLIASAVRWNKKQQDRPTRH